METVNKNTYTFPDRKYKNRFKNYSINGKSLLMLLCFIFSSQVCLGLTNHDQVKYYTITVGRSITLYYYGISGAESFSATPVGMGIECIKITSGKNGQTGWCTIKAIEKTTNVPLVTVSYVYKNAKGEIRDIYNFYNNIKIVELEAVSIPGTLTLGIGESYSFSPTLTPSDASTTYKWDSSDESVAKIENGTITALKAGNTIITCTTHNGKTAECRSGRCSFARLDNYLRQYDRRQRNFGQLHITSRKIGSVGFEEYSQPGNAHIYQRRKNTHYPYR